VRGRPAEDGGNVDVNVVGGDGTEGDMPMALILARCLWNQASCVRDSPIIKRGWMNFNLIVAEFQGAFGREKFSHAG
jgi:hypothetical protein